MQKNGEIFNQLAMISDLLEKTNLVKVSQTIVLEVNKNEFDRIYQMVKTKVKFVAEDPKDTFNIKIGNVNIVFNMNNV
jgi:signal-transduction protein with cAMP-binding, CBS, and nucleotidyltransferase domain